MFNLNLRKLPCQYREVSVMVRWVVSKIEKHADRSGKTTRREDIDNVRRNRFLSRARRPGLVRNVIGTRMSAKTVQSLLKGARLHRRRRHVDFPFTVNINV